MRIYLDNAASTPISKEVLETMTQVLATCHGNPSSIHAEGRALRSHIERSRKTIAQGIGASLGEIFFTSGGTESNNMALKCAVRDLGVTHIITSRIEHHCVLHSVEQLQACHEVNISYVDVDEVGRVNLQQLNDMLNATEEKTLVSLMHANNEIGTMVDLERLSDICEAHDALLHSDTVQSMAHFPFDVSKLRIHFLSGSAHKFHGPKGTGFIYINNDVQLKPLIDGGSQERNMRAGTENIGGIVALAKAFELAIEQMDERRNHIEQLRQHLIKRLQSEFDQIEFNGDWEGNYLYTVLSVSFPPCQKCGMLLMHLDMQGISASGGSACSSGSDVGSHVLKEINKTTERKSIRFSFSHYNTIDEINYLVDKLKALIPEAEMAI